jgi:hypothetical protein
MSCWTRKIQRILALIACSLTAAKYNAISFWLCCCPIIGWWICCITLLSVPLYFLYLISLEEDFHLTLFWSRKRQFLRSVFYLHLLTVSIIHILVFWSATLHLFLMDISWRWWMVDASFLVLMARSLNVTGVFKWSSFSLVHIPNLLTPWFDKSNIHHYASSLNPWFIVIMPRLVEWHKLNTTYSYHYNHIQNNNATGYGTKYTY